MCWRAIAIFASAWLLFATARAEDNTLQYQYLKIYLKINDADQLEKQGNYQAALADFKDCYTRLQKIHNTDPNWESALVIQRMNDCRSKIVDLSNRPLEPSPPMPTAAGPDGSVPSPSASPDVTALQQRLMEVEQELQDTKAKLQNSQIEATTLRSQLDSVNQQLGALKNQQSEDSQVGRLLTENKQLTDRLATAEKEISSIKSPNPKSALSLLRTQLKNTQDGLEASEAANSALQDTTTTLRQQLEDAQSDLRAANQRLASAPVNAPDYETLKRENEVMREILTRELQEQAHRDMAKRLAQEEFDRLRITSKVLQEQLDILGSPMTPPTSDQERALLDNLRVANAQVAPVPPASGNGFAASNDNPNTNGVTTPIAPPVAPAASGETASDTNAPSSSAPSTNAPSSEMAEGTTNAPAAPAPLTNRALADANSSVPAVTPTAPNTVTPAGPPTTNMAEASTNAASPTTPENPSASTNAMASTPETNAPAAATDTNAAPANSTVASSTNSESAPAAPMNATNSETASSDTTTTPSTPAPPTPPDAAEEYATKPRLPDDMRDTAQQAADLFKMQRYDDAAAKYQEIIEKYPESLYAWSNLGVVRFQQGKLTEALQALQQAVKLSPTDAFSYSNLGIVYYQMNQYEQAISALERALALDPTNAKSHNYLGCACSQKGWSEVAEKEFLKAIELDDSFGDAHFNLALVYATEKPPALEMARRHYKRALELGISPDPRLEKLLQMDGVAQNPTASDQK
jgi:Flp pilus assembly protein TadD